MYELLSLPVESCWERVVFERVSGRVVPLDLEAVGAAALGVGLVVGVEGVAGRLTK